MSKKNSNVILKNGFKNFKNLSKVYSHFKSKLIKEKKRTFLIAVSGGPDSLALAFLAKIYSLKKGLSPKFLIVDHKLRPESTKESKLVKNLLKTHMIKLKH